MARTAGIHGYTVSGIPWHTHFQDFSGTLAMSFSPAPDQAMAYQAQGWQMAQRGLQMQGMAQAASGQDGCPLGVSCPILAEKTCEHLLSMG